MRPIDPRLLHVARSTRRYIVAVILTGIVTAALVIIQARLLSGIIVDLSAKGEPWSAVSTGGSLRVAAAITFSGSLGVRSAHSRSLAS